MKKTNIHKLVFAAVLVALAVVGSLISFPIGASKCAPVQHLVNIIGAVFLGPAWAVGVGFTAALLRNLLSLGSLLAFPGSMVGAFVAGMLYKYIKKLPVAYVGELPVRARIGGVVRGLLPDGTPVHTGMKSGDVDPRGIVEYCYTISDKARAIAGGALEAVLHLLKGRVRL